MLDLDAVEVGEPVSGPLAVRAKRGITPYAGGFFVTLVLGNATGELTAKCWLGPEEERVKEAYAALDVGDVVQLDGRVRQYKGSLELHADRVPEPVDERTWEPADFLPATEQDPRTLARRLLARARRIEDEALRELVLCFWEDPNVQGALLEAPASKRNHHAQLGGLVEHLDGVVRLADVLASRHDALDADLIVAGALLHALGKLREHAWGAAIELTPSGRLLGHGPLTDEVIRQAIDAIEGFPEELALKLRHLVLSHPERSSFGASVPARTPEAVILHGLLALDAEVHRVLEAAAEQRASGELGAWSSKLRRYLYVG